MKEMTDQEREYLSKLLDRRHTELLHELHHAMTREYKTGLRQEIDLTEMLKARLAAPVEVAG